MSSQCTHAVSNLKTLRTNDFCPWLWTGWWCFRVFLLADNPGSRHQSGPDLARNGEVWSLPPSRQLHCADSVFTQEIMNEMENMALKYINMELFCVTRMHNSSLHAFRFSPGSAATHYSSLQCRQHIDIWLLQKMVILYLLIFLYFLNWIEFFVLLLICRTCEGMCVLSIFRV